MRRGQTKPSSFKRNRNNCVWYSGGRSRSFTRPKARFSKAHFSCFKTNPLTKKINYVRGQGCDHALFARRNEKRANTIPTTWFLVHEYLFYPISSVHSPCRFFICMASVCRVIAYACSFIDHSLFVSFFILLVALFLVS